MIISHRIWSFMVVASFCVFAVNPVLRAQQADESEPVFKERLTLFLAASYQEKGAVPQTALKQRQQDQLWNFTWDYPQSRYADDARFLVLTMSSIIGKKDAAAMEQLIADFPEGRLEDSTLAYVQEYLNRAGQKPAFWIHLPYKEALVLIRAENAMLDHDYAGALGYADRFIDALDPHDPGLKYDLWWAYKIKYIALQKMDRPEEAQMTKERVLDLFPELKDNPR